MENSVAHGKQTLNNSAVINNEKRKNVNVQAKQLCPRYGKTCKTKQRVVKKCGQFNLEKCKTSTFHVFPDIVTTFVEARWRWTLLYCLFTYMSVWLFFTGIYWSILYLHGDMDQENLPNKLNNTSWEPCIRKIYGITSIFLFSIEVHTTVGYGNRALTMECPEAMFTMCIESILGTMVQSFIVGILFAKLTRPKNRVNTIIFSKNAIINHRDRNLCLLFRVGNTRKSRIIACNIRAYLIRCVTAGDDTPSNEQMVLKLNVDASKDFSFMFPITALHKIDKTSPFYTFSARDILKYELEILVVFEGIIESTGQPVQAKSSYIASEVMWGHRFVPVVEYSKNKGYMIDYSKFDETVRVNTPLCGANKIKNFFKQFQRIKP
ncbi:G protein-activated inward rectifier potassium channel 2-like [Plodia interpunctella]|uniref:G protein-activated inward rectifier potassium channel 2-like n=1 Tax=Plodia interpunctella TaxID=58824 RepID=UPI0023678BED|nr:G protein-activated inward rectifier potassium channel 2-like [Plodia interpunctella]